MHCIEARNYGVKGPPRTRQSHLIISSASKAQSRPPVRIPFQQRVSANLRSLLALAKHHRFATKAGQNAYDRTTPLDGRKVNPGSGAYTRKRPMNWCAIVGDNSLLLGSVSSLFVPAQAPLHKNEPEEEEFAAWATRIE